MIRVFFTGAGGTGKTSVLDSIVIVLAEMGYKVEKFGSVARSFFAENGIATEAAGLDRPEEDRLDFQSRLFDWYCNKLEEASIKAKSTGCDLMFADRSPFDHQAYITYSAPNFRSMSSIKEGLDKSVEILTDARFASEIFLFPSLCNWMKPEVVAEGMRFAPPGKNFMIHSLIKASLDDRYIPYLMFEPESSVEERGNQIIDSLKASGNVSCSYRS
jgi:predicted ATPase